jgi:hypothetical protein
MYSSSTLLRFSTHHVHIKVSEDGVIACFKFNNQGCQYEIFRDQNDASDFVVELMPTVQYTVTFDNEQND